MEELGIQVLHGPLDVGDERPEQARKDAPHGSLGGLAGREADCDLRRVVARDAARGRGGVSEFVASVDGEDESGPKHLRHAVAGPRVSGQRLDQQAAPLRAGGRPSPHRLYVFDRHPHQGLPLAVDHADEGALDRRLPHRQEGPPTRGGRHLAPQSPRRQVRCEPHLPRQPKRARRAVAGRLPEKAPAVPVALDGEAASAPPQGPVEGVEVAPDDVSGLIDRNLTEGGERGSDLLRPHRAGDREAE